MISPLGDSVKEFGALSWSYEITFKSNSRELRFEEARFDKLEYFLIFKQRHVTLYTLHILHFTYICFALGNSTIARNSITSKFSAIFVFLCW